MHLVNLTTAGLKRFVGLSFALFIYSITSAQDNSPYSRYGLGDMVPNQNMSARAMGGISAAYADFRNINFKNPASLGNIYSTIFDVGGEVDIRTLKSTGIASKYTSTNTIFSYLQMAFPLTTARMKKKGTTNWGLSFGLRPVTRISYKVEQNERLTGIDSLNTLYEGSGGVNQFNVSTGIKIRTSNKIKNNPGWLALGVSSGYTFGNKDFSTQKVFINDTVSYYKSNTQTQSHFGGIFVNAGLQYHIPVNRDGYIQLGAYGNFQQNMKARQDHINETFVFDGNGGIAPLDTVEYSKDVAGIVKLPAVFGAGFTYQDSSNHWLIGADFEWSNWKSYRYYGQQDQVQNSWTVKVGAEYYPAKKNATSGKYWSFVRYRVGGYFGPDYVKLNETRKNYALTLGAGLPLTVGRGDLVVMNTGLELGGRGSKQSFSFRETNVRFCIGISMNANWFVKRNYF